MNQKEALQQLLNEKVMRQAELNEIKRQIDYLYKDIAASKMGRWFNSTYLLVKYLLSLILGVTLIVISIILLLYTDAFLSDLQSDPIDIVYLDIVDRIIEITAVILLLCGFVLLYIARIFRKLRKSNRNLSEAHSITQVIIEKYNLHISNSLEEMERIRKIITMGSNPSK